MVESLKSTNVLRAGESWSIYADIHEHTSGLGKLRVFRWGTSSSRIGHFASLGMTLVQ